MKTCSNTCSTQVDAYKGAPFQRSVQSGVVGTRVLDVSDILRCQVACLVLGQWFSGRLNLTLALARSGCVPVRRPRGRGQRCQARFWKHVSFMFTYNIIAPWNFAAISSVARRRHRQVTGFHRSVASSSCSSYRSYSTAGRYCRHLHETCRSIRKKGTGL